MKDREFHPTELPQGQARFYLVFEKVPDAEIEENALAQEIEEIAELSRMAQDITDEDQPRFMTST
ncbi:MAG: hypothetical protein WCD43_17800 [Candidatus Acidiferrales bacterium]